MTTDPEPDIASKDAGRYLRSREVLVPLIILFLLLFSAILRDIPLPQGIFAVCRDSILETFGISDQFLWSGALLICIVIFALVNLRRFWPQSFRLLELLKAGPAIWIATILLCCFVAVVAVRYGLDYQRAGSGTDTLVLLSGALINQGLLWLATSGKTATANDLRRFLVDGFIFVGCLCLSLTPFNPRESFLYHGQLRWIGIFSTPNSLGLFVAVIFMLAVGRSWSYAKNRRFGAAAVYIFPLLVSGICVVKSYSRGAWVAILAGLLYFLWSGLRGTFLGIQSSLQSASADSRWGRKSLFWGVAGVLTGACLSYGIKKASQSKTAILQKVFATFNRSDFSSRNRLGSYQDGINMLADRPLTGYGWRNIIGIHNHLYLQSGLSDGQSLALNDFLKLALHFGIPTFVIFALFAWIWLSARPGGKTQRRNNDIILCRMAALMFAIGFNFNDGLLRLALGGSFWLFLTLSMDFESVTPLGPAVIAPLEPVSKSANK